MLGQRDGRPLGVAFAAWSAPRSTKPEWRGFKRSSGTCGSSFLSASACFEPAIQALPRNLGDTEPRLENEGTSSAGPACTMTCHGELSALSVARGVRIAGHV